VIPSNSNHIIEKHHKKSLSTAVEEREYIQKLEEDDAQCNGVRILGLSKTYEGSLGS
jgi:myo-inositol catabolism protein IolC